jgi:hypothetical protein
VKRQDLRLVLTAIALTILNIFSNAKMDAQEIPSAEHESTVTSIPSVQKWRVHQIRFLSNDVDQYANAFTDVQVDMTLNDPLGTKSLSLGESSVPQPPQVNRDWVLLLTRN